MVEHAVGDHAHIARVRFVEQPPESAIAAQDRIDVVVVIGVIAVIGCRSKDRIEVERCNAEVLQIIQLFGHAQQIAPFEAERIGRRVPGL